MQRLCFPQMAFPQQQCNNTRFRDAKSTKVYQTACTLFRVKTSAAKFNVPLNYLLKGSGGSLKRSMQ